MVKAKTAMRNQSVSFNLADPEQKADFEFATRGNFSGYVRYLIRHHRLMAQGKTPTLVNQGTKEPKADKVVANSMDGFM